jgi:hypothetical protein
VIALSIVRQAIVLVTDVKYATFSEGVDKNDLTSCNVSLLEKFIGRQIFNKIPRIS